MSDDIVKTLLESLTDEQKAELMQVMAKGLLKSKEREETTGEKVASEPRRSKSEDFTTTRNNNFTNRNEPVKAKKNQWQDNGEGRDPSFDPEAFEKMGKTARNRGKVKKKDVECHVCGRTFSVNSGLVYGEFIRCNRCTGK